MSHNLDSSREKVLSVSQLTRQMQTVMHERFPAVWVSGEISSLSQPKSGHIYLTLNDDDAQLRAVIWRRDAIELNFDLADGLEVVCCGEIDIYPPRGSYQLIVRQIEPLGLGALQLAFRKLHARLAAEGLFDASRKLPLPTFPSRIAVVTSPTGAALRDFLQVAMRRWDNVEILVVPTKVQGVGSTAEIARAIERAGRLRPTPDVLVVARGGGGIEDLWSFNEEQVVRAISDCNIPVCTGIGHEVDVTLADLAADVRALTPSEAAELVVPSKQAVIQRLTDARSRLQVSLQARVAFLRQRLESLASRRAVANPLDRVQLSARRLDELETRIDNASRHALQRGQQAAAHLSARLQAVSPLNVLSRGYSFTQTVDDRLICDAEKVAPGDRILTRLSRGSLESVVQSVIREEQASMAESVDRNSPSNQPKS